MAGKTDDSRCIPLCTPCHLEVHRGALTFQRRHNLDFEAIIKHLNRIYEEAK
jgi:hypothetical protein